MTSLGDEYTPAEARTNRVFNRLTSKIGAIIMGAADDAATAALDQLAKAKIEIDGVIAELTEQSVKPETIERLQAVSQAFDDVVPDEPVE